tara:strand:+ start:1017 stop:1664 length:648 start_codon:yes stop_codon:yes gene_type:complete
MNLNNYFYTFPGALGSRFCDEIIKYALAHKEIIGVTNDQGEGRDITKQPLNKKETKVLKQLRDSNIVWLNEPWIYKEIMPFIDKANKDAGWNFEYDFSETCQFTKYKKNQYYDWHSDSSTNPYNEPNHKGKHGKIRKLSVTCQLSDSQEYKGGELEFDFRNQRPKYKNKSIVKNKDCMQKGSIVVFPSFVWHRVRPVTEGTRYSLVIWNLGKPYK